MRPIDADELRKLCSRMMRAPWNDMAAPISWAKAYGDFRDDVDSIPTLTPPNDMDLGFDVIDTKTGEYPDLEKIALTEEWARGLVYCDMDGFAVREDGSLILLDECGNCVSCPPGRFEIRLQDGGAER